MMIKSQHRYEVILTLTGDDIEAARDALRHCRILLHAVKKRISGGPAPLEVKESFIDDRNEHIETINALRQALAAPPND
jgi:hypothetical protein